MDHRSEASGPWPRYSPGIGIGRQVPTGWTAISGHSRSTEESGLCHVGHTIAFDLRICRDNCDSTRTTNHDQDQIWSSWSVGTAIKESASNHTGQRTDGADTATETRSHTDERMRRTSRSPALAYPCIPGRASHPWCYIAPDCLLARGPRCSRRELTHWLDVLKDVLRPCRLTSREGTCASQGCHRPHRLGEVHPRRRDQCSSGVSRSARAAAGEARSGS